MTLTEKLHAGGYVVSEPDSKVCREQITVAAAADLVAGQVLGKITRGVQSVAAPVAFAGNAGNGALGTWTVDANALPGDYKIVFIEPVTNLGNYEVFRPDGALDGTGKAGTAYDGMINGTAADGSADWGAGDGATVTVSYAAGSGKYVMHDAAAVDGSQNACALLFDAANAASADVVQTAHVRGPMEFNASEIVWKSGISGPNKTAGLAALAALGMVAR